jgi:hypothetical protein
MIIAIIIIVVFIVGLGAFMSHLSAIKKAAKDGWNEGKKK